MVRHGMRWLVVLGAVLGLAASAAAAGDVDLVVKWPQGKPAPQIVRETDTSGKTWVLVERTRIVLVNYPAHWNAQVTPSPVSQPAIRLVHDLAPGKQMSVHSFLDKEELTNLVLSTQGQTVEFPSANRVSIEVSDITS